MVRTVPDDKESHSLNAIVPANLSPLSWQQRMVLTMNHSAGLIHTPPVIVTYLRMKPSQPMPLPPSSKTGHCGLSATN